MSETSRILDKFKGAMLASAAGDALGYPFDGMKAEAIAEKFGRVTDFVDGRFGNGCITSDTQMAVSLAQAIAEAGYVDLDHTAFKFTRVFEAGEKGLKEVRSPGVATERAGRRLLEGVAPEESGIPSAGCGAAVRAFPVGLRFYYDPAALREAAVTQASITHSSEEAQAGAAAIAFTVAAGVTDKGKFDREAFVHGLAEFVDPISSDFAEKLAGLCGFLEAPLEEGLAFTGTSGYIMEAVPAALLAFLQSPRDLERSVTTAVSAGGCTGGVAAMAGAMSGAMNAVGAIPERWLSALEGRAYIDGLAERLWSLTPAWKPKNRF